MTIKYDQFGNALGWAPELEDQHNAAIAAMSVPELRCSAPTSIPDDFDVPDFVQDNQGQWPFCHSHMRTGCSEALTWMATEGQILPQHSRKFAAITNMRMDGNDRAPNGASISGSMRAAVKYGEVAEKLFPYYTQGERYSNVIPQSILDAASKSRITTLVPNIRSFEEFDKAMVTGLVVAAFGISWTEGWSNLRGVEHIENYPGGRYLGEHALFIMGWKTRANARCYRIHNSHPQWGQRNRVSVSPRIIDNICRTSRHGVILASDMKLQDVVLKPRDFSWLDKTLPYNRHVTL